MFGEDFKINLLKKIEKLCDMNKNDLVNIVAKLSTISLKELKSWTKGELISKILASESFITSDDRDKEEILKFIYCNNSSTIAEKDKIKLLSLVKDYFNINYSIEVVMTAFPGDKRLFLDDFELSIFESVALIPETKLRSDLDIPILSNIKSELGLRVLRLIRQKTIPTEAELSKDIDAKIYYNKILKKK